MSQEKVKQLEVTRHFKVHAGNFKLDVHATESGVGVWLDGDSKPGVGTIGMYAGNGCPPYFMVYPHADYAESGKPSLPFAISASGLQVPHPDGTITTLSLKDISRLIKQCSLP